MVNNPMLKFRAGRSRASGQSIAVSPGSGRIAVRALHPLQIFRIGERGETLVEFAMVAPMLLLLLLIIVDLGLMLTTQSLLDGAARDASRLIRTGQVSAAGNTVTTFQTLLCSDMKPVMSTATCDSQVVFEVQTFSNFGNVAFTPCTRNQGQTGSGTVCNFTPGTANQIVGVQVTYNRPFMIPWVGRCLTRGACWFGPGTGSGSGAGSSTVPLISTVVFENEPFPS
jgi:Flp pilus assembly protein TadG